MGRERIRVAAERSRQTATMMIRLGQLGIALLLGCGGAGAGHEVGSAAQAGGLELTEVVFRSAVEHALRTASREPAPRLVCLSRSEREAIDPSPAVVASLQRVDSLVVRPISGCRFDAVNRWMTGHPLMLDTLTGQRGIKVWAAEPRVLEDRTFTVDIGYYAHGRSAAHWVCQGRRGSAGWEVSDCQLVRIS